MKAHIIGLTKISFFFPKKNVTFPKKFRKCRPKNRKKFQIFCLLNFKKITKMSENEFSFGFWAGNFLSLRSQHSKNLLSKIKKKKCKKNENLKNLAFVRGLDLISADIDFSVSPFKKHKHIHFVMVWCKFQKKIFGNIFFLWSTFSQFREKMTAKKHICLMIFTKKLWKMGRTNVE